MPPPWLHIWKCCFSLLKLMAIYRLNEANERIAQCHKKLKETDKFTTLYHAHYPLFLPIFYPCMDTPLCDVGE